MSQTHALKHTHAGYELFVNLLFTHSPFQNSKDFSHSAVFDEEENQNIL